MASELSIDDRILNYNKGSISYESIVKKISPLGDNLDIEMLRVDAYSPCNTMNDVSEICKPEQQVYLLKDDYALQHLIILEIVLNNRGIHLVVETDDREKMTIMMPKTTVDIINDIIVNVVTTGIGNFCHAIQMTWNGEPCGIMEIVTPLGNAIYQINIDELDDII